MRFRFTLSHSILGDLQISAPDGWEDAVLKLERDKTFHSLIEYFEGSFIFYGDNGEVNGGIDFIKEVIETYGIDADLNIVIEITLNGYTYEIVFIGLLKLDAAQETEDNKIQVPIVRNDFWNKFINRIDTPVDLQSTTSLDNTPIDNIETVNTNLVSQKIPRVSSYDLVSGFIIGEDWVNGAEVDSRYYQFTFDIDRDEISERFTIPNSLNDNLPVSNYTVELGGSYRIQAGIIFGLVWSASQVVIDLANTTTFNFWVQKNDEAPIGFSMLQINIDRGGDDAGYYFIDTVLELQPGDEIRIYGKFTVNEIGEFLTRTAFIIYGQDNSEVDVSSIFLLGPGDTIDFGNPVGDYRTFINITAQTVFEDSVAESFLLQDAGAAIIDRITGKNNSFYSEYTGSSYTKSRQYEIDGCAWKYSLIKGLQLRRYTLSEKPFFSSFKKWWDGAAPILNLGLGYEDLNNEEVIRVENQEYFYEDDPSIYISNVRSIRRTYDQERIIKTVKIGYKQWQSENISGIDDPQTKHTYASRLQKTGSELTLESEFIAASLAIETTRRTTRQKSADYKFDNETFIIALNPIPIDVSPDTSPDVDDYLPELDENFSSITNLLNPDTRYNSRITPARNFIRHLKYLSGGLQSYPGSVFKFTSGEGNYDMVSDMNVSDGCDEYAGELSEKQDIEISDQIINLADLFEVVVPMEWEEYQVIRENRRKSIGISQTTTGHISFFIKELEYEVTKSQATIRCWPVEPMQIRVIESMFNMVTCAPVNPLTADNTLVTVDSTEITVDQTEYIL